MKLSQAKSSLVVKGLDNMCEVWDLNFIVADVQKKKKSEIVL